MEKYMDCQKLLLEVIPKIVLEFRFDSLKMEVCILQIVWIHK